MARSCCVVCCAVLKSSCIFLVLVCASPEGRAGVSSYTGEGRHLGGIIGIPWPGLEAGLGVHVAIIRSFLFWFWP